jgi:hypothetical protein
MAINESIMVLVDQGLAELTTVQVSFWIKLLAIFGAFYLLNILFKTGGSLIHMMIYVMAFFKWLIYKIMRRDDK